MGWDGGFIGSHASNAAALISPRIPTESTQQDEVSSPSTRFSTSRKQKGKVKNANFSSSDPKTSRGGNKFALSGSSQPCYQEAGDKGEYRQHPMAFIMYKP